VISLVVPIYEEETIIPRLHEEVVRAMDGLGDPWEVTYVDDGSRDRSLELLRAIAERDARVTVLELSRNWGHQAALTAGLASVEGDCAVLMDGDLQDPPSVIPKMVAAWKEGAEVVIAERRSRLETGVRRALFPFFYSVLGFLSDYPIPLNAGIFGLLDRRAVDAINRLSESNRYLPGLRAWVGFKTAVVSYDRAPRAAGEPKQSLLRLIGYALDAIFSFSYKPLRLSLFAGLTVAFLSLVFGLLLVVLRFLGKGLFGIPVVPGYTSTIVSITFLGGAQLISIGILGEYLGRIYDEVKRRPLFIVRRVHRSSPPPPPAS
jgi:polyisoprenyl-phosphate glycosyltransferase